jgi:hypothetical protein
MLPRIALVTPPHQDYRLIPLTQGQFAKVSPHRFEEINRHKWQATRGGHDGANFYAVRFIYLGKVNGKYKYRTMSMHRQILGLEHGDPREGDHFNHDTLDNTDENLRIATRRQNACNGRTRADNKSGYKGVCWVKSKNLWMATISLNGKNKYLGLRKSAEQAYRELYMPAAIEHYGEFACLESPCYQG